MYIVSVCCSFECIVLGYRWFIGIAGMGLFTLKIKFSFGFKICYLIRKSNTVYYYNENIVELSLLKSFKYLFELQILFYV